MSNLDFSDVLELLLPEFTGGLRRRSDELFPSSPVAGSFSFLNIFGVIGEITSTAFIPLVQSGDIAVGTQIQFSGTLFNNNTYTVSAITATDVIEVTPVAAVTTEVATAQFVYFTQVGGYLKRLLEGMGEGHQTLYEFLKQLAYIREPLLTPILSDLEKEYGVRTNTMLSDAERRENLHGIVYAPRNRGTHEYLQERLQASGFDVQVYVNSPATDPGRFAYGAGGELVVNNVLYDPPFDAARDSDYEWSFVFFVGGEAIRGDNGVILDIAPVIIPDESRVLFRELILKYKPLHSWAVAVINDAGYFTFAPGDDMILDEARGFANADSTTGGYWYEGSFGGPMYVMDDVTYEFVYDDVTGDYLTEE